MHLIRKIKGLERDGASVLRDETEMRVDEAEKRMVPGGEDTIDKWLTGEDKNLLRYYYYILHDVDDTVAGTLDYDTSKRITATVSPEWQERHEECLARLIQEIKRDYVTNMKKSIVDFTLQEPFEEAYAICAPVSIACIIIHDINANYVNMQN